MNAEDIRLAVAYLDSLPYVMYAPRPTEGRAISLMSWKIPHKRKSYFSSEVKEVRFDPCERFHQTVENIMDVLDQKGSFWCKCKRGWKLVSDPDRISIELCESMPGVMPSHVREAQRRIKHASSSHSR